MTGKELFELYVHVGLCIDVVYRWDELSEYRKGCWDEMARLILLGKTKYPY